MAIKLRAALLHRVSTIDQNPRAARSELRAAARRMNAQIVLDVEETGSGAKNDRPGLQRILAAARAGSVDAVLVWKLDRFGRSALDLLGNLRQLESAGVELQPPFRAARRARAALVAGAGVDLQPFRAASLELGRAALHAALPLSCMLLNDLYRDLEGAPVLWFETVER